ncbi:hypothetical protein [Halapricum hydrolyticum]|uniref:Uncharacterized protein n=1 Tax=Halapricum hydrolyticum TaxID=2979991 RepID=A0AAE3IB49_9EURY|nr:hypothetical protein [Halapricum hydrolyticum]MCU4717594.1 hypothetical protein [Halapricum hydrolyticum]MCU4726877.1 hypothetical protein [Halapricum hydrolyticum]
MARLYHIKNDPSNLYLIHPFNGNPRKISCDPVAQRLLAELDYEPEVLHQRQGDKIPADLLWALWDTGLIGTDDVGEQDPDIGRVQEKTGYSVPLQEADVEVLKELIQSYTGQSRRSLEEVAESLGLTLNANSATNSLSEGNSEVSSEYNSQSGLSNNIMIEKRLKAVGVSDMMSAPAFREWYEETVTGPRIEDFFLSSETTRALVFLARRTDVTSVKLTGKKDSEHIQISGDIQPNGFSEMSETITSVTFHTGDYLLPPEDHLTGTWDDEFLFVNWDICSSASLTRTDAELDLSTGVTIHPSGISAVHTGVDGGSGHTQEEFVARRHQTEIVDFVLRQHISDSGLFALPESRSYTEYTCSVEYTDLPGSKQNTDK